MRKNKLSSPGSGPGGGGVSVTGGERKFEKHCLICLQPQTLQTLMEVDGRTPELRKDFQALIYYLTGTDPNQGRVRKIQTEDSQECDDDIGAGAGIWMTKVTNLPPLMCASCHDILGELYRLHRELLRTQWLIQKQTELARREIVIIAGEKPGSSSSSRRLLHSKILSSGTPEAEADDMIKFVGELHSKIVVAESRKQNVIFPSFPPPYFVPEAGSKSKSTSSSSWLPLQLPTGAIRLSRCDMDNVSKSREAATSIIQPPGQTVDGVGDDDYDILIPSPSYSHDASEGDCASKSEDSDPSYSVPNTIPVKNEKRKRRQGPSEPDDDDDDDKYDPPPTKKVSKASPAQKTERGSNGSRYHSTARSLVKTDTGTSQYCDLCGELIPSPDIQTHLESQHHVQEFISKCPNPSCPCVFSCEGKLQKHLRFHPSKYRCLKAARLPTKLQPRKCRSCRFKTFSNPEFREHLQQHETELMETERRSQFQCPLPGCRHCFVLRQCLEEHLFSHNAEEKDNRQKHLLKSKVPPQECDLCGMSILSSVMVAHLEGHSPQLKDYITKCLSPSCLLVFSCVGKMDKHLRGEWVKGTGGNVWWKGSKPCRKAAKIPPGVAPVKCDACSEMVANRSFLKNHLQQHELLDPDKQEKILPCPMPDCDKRYALRQSVEEHLISHDLRPRTQISSQDGLKQECSVCKETIPVGEISEHLGESHEVVEIIPCRKCPFLFHSWESLLDHLFEHRLGSTSLGMVCDMCGDEKLKFKLYESLRQHFFTVHKIGAKQICGECDAEFFSKDRLAQHERSHSANTSKRTKRAAPSKCDQCPDTFPTKDMLLNHKIKVHGAPPMSCKFCGQGFLSVHSWRKHQRAHLGLKKTFACRVEGCGKVFKVKTGWRRHEKEGHLPPGSAPPAKLFICDICGVGYNFKPSLKGHIDKVHLKKDPGKGSHICEICGLSLTTSSGLAKHKEVHNEEKPYSCPVCYQPFRRKNGMLRHLKNHEERGDDFKPRGAFQHERRRRTKK